MSVSLSALVPVRNVQAVLEPALLCLLDTLAELTHSVELIVLDDGSTDATIEVLSEMTVQYPQIKGFRFGQPRGWAEAIRTALAEATGQILFFEEPGCLMPWQLLPLLWNLALKHPVVIGRPAGAGLQSGGLSGAGPEGQLGISLSPATYQLVRRATMLRLASRLTDGVSFRHVLLQEGIGWQERILSFRPRRQQEILYPLFRQAESQPSRTDRPQPQASPPNYLVHLLEEKVS